VCALLVAVLGCLLALDYGADKGLPADQCSVPDNNNLHDRSVRLFEGQVAGGECLTVGPDGFVYTGLLDGRIVKFHPVDRQLVNFTKTRGRPLGLRFLKDGSLLVADGPAGLTLVSPDGSEVKALLNEVEGVGFGLADDVEVDEASGVAYLTDAFNPSRPPDQSAQEVFSGQSNGRVILFNMTSHEASVLLDSIPFPNGVCHSHTGDDIILVSTTYRSLGRFPANAATAQKKPSSIEWFGCRLPTMPDNIVATSRGTYWIAGTGKTSRLVEVLDRFPVLRLIFGRLVPVSFINKLALKHATVLEVSQEGKVIRSIEDSSGTVDTLAHVLELDGKIFLGSYANPYILVHDL
jgi:ribose transport system permease protein